MILHLVRHGESTWNLEGRLQGQVMDVPLTPEGRRQAAAAAKRLSKHRLAAVWSSDQARALESAWAIAAPHGLEVVPTALLREQALGDLEGRLTTELQALPSPEGKHISEVPPGGAASETMQQVHERLQRLNRALAAQFPDAAEVALVSHGDTIRILLSLLAGRGHREVDWVPVANGQVLTATLRSGTPSDDC